MHSILIDQNIISILGGDELFAVDLSNFDESLLFHVCFRTKHESQCPQASLFVFHLDYKETDCQ